MTSVLIFSPYCEMGRVTFREAPNKKGNKTFTIPKKIKQNFIPLNYKKIKNFTIK